MRPNNSKRPVSRHAGKKPRATEATPKRPPLDTDSGKALPTAANITTILRFDPAWAGVVAYDAFADAIISTRPPPWNPIDAPEHVEAGPWSDADTARLVHWLQRAMRWPRLTPQVVEQAVMVAAEANRVHPVRDYLRGLRWDRRKRLDRLVPGYFGGEDTPYTRAVGAKWMIAACARVWEPGCQADNTLILESQAQGRRKSSAFRALVPVAEWYGETPIDIGNKDSYQALRGKWIYGLDELDSIHRAENTRTKNFLTAPSDHYRPSYGRRAQTYRRQCVFAGTTNQDSYLTDASGNRRYWPVRITTRADTEAIIRDRDQLWAEAYARYRAKEKWWDDTESFRALCRAEQAERLEPDDWLGPIEEWVRKHDDGNGILTLDVLRDVFGLDSVSITKAQTMRAAIVLKSIGYVRGAQVRAGEHVDGAHKAVRPYILADETARKQQAWRYRQAAQAKATKGRKSKANGLSVSPLSPPSDGGRPGMGVTTVTAGNRPPSLYTGSPSRRVIPPKKVVTVVTERRVKK